ncbi:Cl-channel protein [Cylindrobasidium torrendii FP15055 ss-10]|uniref:Chloride channel protein n=1 Tax=Cylindrobasidium torrendii FP15055 ss-10 TaxID=1314674 RepID=A0A0D7BBF8_9AGAR|nr:Cl-channel protein [Cylindrobasidium torrendii FP15055 ss-10]
MSPRNDHAEEEYELTASGNLHPAYTTKYKDGSSIDWLNEELVERARTQQQRSQRGIRGIFLPWRDSAQRWFVIIVTGIGVGLAGAWLDVLVKWLSDLREGRCSYGLFYNQALCCNEIDPGDACIAWKTWTQVMGIHNGLGQALVQSFIYVICATLFAGCSAFLVQHYAPYAFHTGIPEIKAILGGYVFDAFLTPWTLLIKALGLALAVASGLSLGKEGPLVHVACCMAHLLSQFFEQFRTGQGKKRKLLAAAAAAGVSVAFGSPLGGVLFGLEELDAFASESEVMWRGFVASAIAAVALQYVDPFGTGKLVLFQVTSVSDDTWRAFELIPWMGLGVIGGLLGHLMIKMNVQFAVFRRTSALHEWPVLEVVTVSALTASLSYLIVFARVQTSELVANLFQECDPARGDYHGLCNSSAMWENVFLLSLTAVAKFGLTAWTFGMMIPAGIFLPTIAIGACLGRVVGLLVQAAYRAWPTAWVFASCPPDPLVGCISPGFYAVIGASGMLGGVTRMTVSLVVILFELTGALSHVLPIMISVVTAKWVGDAVGEQGIYAAWIAMRAYPWLPGVEHRDGDERQTGEGMMRRVESLTVVEDGACTPRDIDSMLSRCGYSGFPVVSEGELMGYVTRDGLRNAIDNIPVEQQNRTCIFAPRFTAPDESEGERIDMSGVLDRTVLHLKKEVPQELVVSMFQKMSLRHILFTSGGKLEGMVTKTDVAALMTSHFPYAGALAH